MAAVVSHDDLAEEQRSVATVAGVGLGLAGAAGVCLAAARVLTLRPTAVELPATALTILGWTLLAWAALLGATATVHLVRALVGRRRTSPRAAALVAATGAAVAGVLVVLPLLGSR